MESTPNSLDNTDWIAWFSVGCIVLMAILGICLAGDDDAD